MNLLQQFKSYIKQHDLFHSKDKLLLAVSGGVDSVSLCELCRQAGYDFAIAHCNFRLRDNESERDKEFVEQLAKKYGVEFFLKEFDTKNYAEENKLSLQEAARNLRYSWFNEIISNSKSEILNPKFVATAHHRDDNIETVLMNFFKGTGIAGLRGILPKQGKIIRPLLFASREDILSFAGQNNLQWVEDSSNESEKYTRNYFRLSVIPLIEKIYPGANSNLADNLERFRDIEELYRQAISEQKKKLIERKENEFHIPVLKLKKTSPLKTIVYEVTREFGFGSKQVDEAIALLDAETGRYIQSSTHRIIKNRNWLIIVPLRDSKVETVLIEGIGNWELGIGVLSADLIPNSKFQIPNSSAIACVNADDIKFPLLVRKWKQGDYFYPFGMKKKKKLARFFIDQKLSKTDKEKIFVLEMDKKIIWVVGMRIDDRFRITDKTKNIMKITLKP
jgi:tRNA(Ile)-lysidine synthase